MPAGATGLRATTLARKASGAHPPLHAHAVTWRMAPAYALLRSLPGGSAAPLA